MIRNVKLRKYLVLALKLMLFVLVIYFFYKQISKLEINQFRSITLSKPIYLLVVIILFIVNWGFELMKWKIVLEVNKIEYNLKQWLSSFFSGIATGVVTPNRIGNFIGRIIFFKGKVKASLILGTLYSNFAQFLVTVIFGVVSLGFFLDFILERYGSGLVYVSLLGVVLLGLFYFAVPFVKLDNIRMLRKRLNVLTLFQTQAKLLYIRFLMYSTGRYLAFTLQYLFMLSAFDTPPSFALLGGIFIFYLVSTMIPSVFGGKLLIRETAGLIVLGLFVENSAVILVSSLLLWCLNLGLPTLTGLIFILRKKFFVND